MVNKAVKSSFFSINYLFGLGKRALLFENQGEEAIIFKTENSYESGVLIIFQ
jgi:hypothetical protein